MIHRLWQYDLTSPATSGRSFLASALDARPGDVVRKADKLHVGLCLGVSDGIATVRWAWQQNQSDQVPLAELQRQLRTGESAPSREYDGRCKHCYHDHSHTLEEHTASVASYLNTERTLHEAAAGAKCHAGPDGFCLTCGVEMTACNVCNGIGYHRADCTAFADELIVNALRLRCAAAFNLPEYSHFFHEDYKDGEDPDAALLRLFKAEKLASGMDDESVMDALIYG